MGKIRVKTFGNEELELKEKQEAEKRKESKINAAKAASKEKVEKTPVEASTKTEDVKSETSEEKTEDKKEVVKKTQNKKEQKETHSQKYQDLNQNFDKTKTYSLSEGLDILEKLQRKSFDETVELHANTTTTGVSGNITLPHGTGKKIRVAIATEELIAEVEKGKIDFDILISEPMMMAKLAKVARVLGPKGLMPNPKNGTVTANPQEAVKKYEGGQINFKTEAKSPIMHLIVGKMSFGKEKLTQNIESLLSAVKKSNIINLTLKSTMSPGIKIKI